MVEKEIKKPDVMLMVYQLGVSQVVVDMQQRQ